MIAGIVVLVGAAVGIAAFGVASWARRAHRADPAPTWTLALAVTGALLVLAVTAALTLPRGWAWPNWAMLVLIYLFILVLAAFGVARWLGRRRQRREAQGLGLPTRPVRVSPATFGTTVGILAILLFAAVPVGGVYLLAALAPALLPATSEGAAAMATWIIWGVPTAAALVGLLAGIWQRRRRQREHRQYTRALNTVLDTE